MVCSASTSEYAQVSMGQSGRLGAHPLVRPWAEVAVFSGIQEAPRCWSVGLIW